ncbi:MAG TPA: TolC family protein [Parachlamydiaceae bacterium]|nr:TolC family protein [Parachlamydiaceae bacterium]
MKNRFLLSSLYILLATGALQATPAMDQPLTLAELVDIALENHPSTKQAWWNANRAAAALGSAKSSYYPNISLAASASNGRDFKFIDGPDVSYTIVGVDIFVDALLYDFGARKANVDIARASLLAANWQTDWAIQKVMIKVLENAYATLLAQEVMQAATISLNEAEKVLNAAKELNRTGLTPITDVYTTQATFSLMRMDLSQQKASLDIQRGRLAASLGLPATTCLEIIVPETISCHQLQQVDELVAIALQQRADIMAKQARLQESVSNQIKAKAAYWPKISFAGRGGYNRAIDDRNDGAQYRVSINLEAPLFNGFDTMYQNRMAFADTQISNEQLIELQLDITLEVLTYSRTLQAALEMLPDAEENLNSSTKAYEGVLEKYKAGKEGIADLSIAQRQLAAARVRVSEVRTNVLVSIANLAYATGTLAPYMETPCK